MALIDELKLGRAGLEQALASFLAALGIPHIAGDPESGPTELQRDRLAHIVKVIEGVLGTGQDLEIIEKLQAGRSGPLGG